MMPTKPNGTTVKPATAAPTKRFELPALNFKFASLTDGTNIPPPPPSPVRVEVLTPPKTPLEEQKKLEAVVNVSGVQVSPTLSIRQGSIRRLFSKSLLNPAYQNGEEIERPETQSSSHADVKKSKRLSGWFSRLRSYESGTGSNNNNNNNDDDDNNSSSSNGSSSSSSSNSNSSSKNDINKRGSIISITEEKEKPSGPTPPMIPELGELKSKLGVGDDSALGSDLFKDIN